jgi:anaerobic magnesium-protoporphyrin IX monomethyl ester cyclase
LGVKNMWFKSEGQTIRNPLRPLIQDLDAIPLPDYSCKNHFLATRNGVEHMTPAKLVDFKGERFRSIGGSINYPVMTSRGCPFACTYCCNSVYHRLYPAQNHLRWRSAENVIRELGMIRENVAPIGRVIMVDDNLTARSGSKLKHFCEAYKREVDIPFFAQVSPLTISEEKMEILLAAGCVKVVMGIETGSEKIAVMYNREKSHAAVPAAVSVVEKYRSRMPLPPSYQFIIDNPYETVEEMIETLRFALSLPQPWDNPIYSLMLFPGTPLYNKACSDGLIKNKQDEVYGKNWLDQSKPFFQLWIRLYRANLFPLTLRLLLTPWIVRLSASPFADKVWRLRIFRWLWMSN